MNSAELLELLRRFRADRDLHEKAGETAQVEFYDGLISSFIEQLGPDRFPAQGQA